MIGADQHFLIWFLLLGASVFGIVGEKKRWFGNFSGALVTILAMAVLASLGIVPSASDSEISVPVYQFVFTYIIPTAIPLLLFNVDLRKIIREAGRLLSIFLIGSLGVAIGAIIAAFVLDLGPDTYKIAGTFIGTYTGGSVNFMAVATTLNFLESPLFPATIAVDNVFTNLYIAFLFLLPSLKWLLKYFPEEAPVDDQDNHEQGELTGIQHPMQQLAIVLFIAAGICALGYWLSPLLAQILGTDISLEIMIITILIILLANFFPAITQPLETMAFEVGMLLLYIFLAVIGAASDIREIIQSTPLVLVFAAITLIVHLVICLIGGKLLKISLKEIAIASCANAGGPSVAAPMAATFNMRKSVSPAILIGILGYVIGTFLGVGVGLFLQ